MIQTNNDTVRGIVAGIALAITGILFGRFTAPTRVQTDAKWQTVIDSLQRKENDLNLRLRVAEKKSDSITAELVKAENEGSRLQQELAYAKAARSQKTKGVFELNDSNLVHTFTIEVSKVKQAH
jgi:hypothetical protein